VFARARASTGQVYDMGIDWGQSVVGTISTFQKATEDNMGLALVEVTIVVEDEFGIPIPDEDEQRHRHAARAGGLPDGEAGPAA